MRFGLIAALCAVSACNPFYVLRAGYEEVCILARREAIVTRLQDQNLSTVERRKLALVLEARDFAKSIGLTPDNSFTSYAAVDRPVLAWVLAASKPDAFKLYTWWFPIVGTLPYKGFFEEEEARAAAADLTELGYETWLRPTDAFSTLGWFDDPLLSTTLRQSETRLVNIVLHESVHNTLWVAGQAIFSESLANAVAGQATKEFFEQKLAACSLNPICTSEELSFWKKSADAAVYEQRQENDLAQLLTSLFADLDQLYRSEIGRAEKLEQRRLIFDRGTAGFRSRYRLETVLREPNNAELIQLKIYRTGLSDFQHTFESCSRKWPCFWDTIRLVVQAPAEAAENELFEALRRYNSGTPP